MKLNNNIFSKAFGYLLLLLLMFSLISCKQVNDETNNNETNNSTIRNNYLIALTENTFNSETLTLETYDKDGQLIDSKTFDTPLIWHSRNDNGYLSFYGSDNFIIVDSNKNEIINIKSPGRVEDSYIFDDNLFLLTNDGMKPGENVYQSLICKLKLDGKNEYQAEEIESINMKAIPYDLYMNDKEIYFVGRTFDGNFEKTEAFVRKYDLDMNLIENYERDDFSDRIIGTINDEIVLASQTGYTLYPSKRYVESIAGPGFSFMVGKAIIKEVDVDGVTTLVIEEIDDKYQITSKSINLGSDSTLFESLVDENQISVFIKSDDGNKIRFYDLETEKYDDFVYNIKDGAKVVGAYRIAE